MTLADLHGIGTLVTLLAIVAFGLAMAGIALLDRFSGWLPRLRTGLLVVIGLQVLLGAATWLSGDRPAQDLHLLYGAGLLVLLPLAGSFAEDAPPRDRAAVFAIAAVVGVLLIWRLLSTG